MNEVVIITKLAAVKSKYGKKETRLFKEKGITDKTKIINENLINENGDPNSEWYNFRISSTKDDYYVLNYPSNDKITGSDKGIKAIVLFIITIRDLDKYQIIAISENSIVYKDSIEIQRSGFHYFQNIDQIKDGKRFFLLDDDEIKEYAHNWWHPLHQEFVDNGNENLKFKEFYAKYNELSENESNQQGIKPISSGLDNHSLNTINKEVDFKNNFHYQDIRDFSYFELETINPGEYFDDYSNNENLVEAKKDEDYILEMNKSIEIGHSCEEYVKYFEIKRLEKLNLKTCAEKVKIVSEYPLLGYDILSYNDDGTERYIEVKCAKKWGNDLYFQISDNQIKKSKQSNNYYIYLVKNVESNNRQIKAFKGNLLKKEFLHPTKYDVVIEDI